MPKYLSYFVVPNEPSAVQLNVYLQEGYFVNVDS